MKSGAIGAGALAIAAGLAACATAHEGDPRSEASMADAELVALGRDAFDQCDGCHALKQGERSGMGPSLYGIAGRKAGALPDYPYSEALAGSGVIWDAASLGAFLADPSGFVPGSEMQRGTVRDPELRAAIVAFLLTPSE